MFIGTSGWFYSWNPNGSFDWFVKFSGLNAVELNMSFYRFPFPNMVRSWSFKGKPLRWAIKVNRLITHTSNLEKEPMSYGKNFTTYSHSLSQT